MPLKQVESFSRGPPTKDMSQDPISYVSFIACLSWLLPDPLFSNLWLPNTVALILLDPPNSSMP